MYNSNTHLEISSIVVETDGYSTALSEAKKLKTKDSYIGKIERSDN